MRAYRGLTVAALLLLHAGAAEAQASRGFKDSWFWGAKSGLLNYQLPRGSLNGTTATTILENRFAVLGGGDWMITRTNGGLYVAFDYSFLSTDTVFVNDSISPLDITPRVVSIRGLRRFTMAGVLFPLQTYRLHPYMGFGFTLSHVAKADPQGTYRNSDQKNLAESLVRLFRSTAAPAVIVGAQLRLPLASGFVQLSTTPANDNFFLFTGSNWRTSLEAGLRYNVGTSIDRLR